MGTETLNAAIAVDFSLIGTKLHAMYKKEEQGYKILLIPTLQSDNEGITIGELIKDIQSLTQKTTGATANTQELENVLKGAAAEGASSGAEEKTKDASTIDVDKIRIILNMAYLYIDSKGENSQMEYAFNLDILTEGLIPSALASIVTVDHIGIAVWNTKRTQILNQMSIASIEDYLGLPKAATE